MAEVLAFYVVTVAVFFLVIIVAAAVIAIDVVIDVVSGWFS